MPAIYTVPSNCRDCYKCVRHCPVKAIKVEGNHTEIEEALCIACGECVNTCPQNAKIPRDDRQAVLDALASGRKLVLSLAPSFASEFPGEAAKRLIGAAKRFGFSHISETSSAASAVAHAHVGFAAKQDGRLPVIASSCPVVVNLVEKYYPEAVGNLAPVASPMIIHMRWLKSRFGDECFTVFAGPCIAKKQEAERVEYRGLADAVLTFQELLSVFAKRGISYEECIPVSPDNASAKAKSARSFAVEGGLLASAGSGGASDIAITGIDGIREALDHLEDYSDVRIVEMLACKGGCIMGSAIGKDRGSHARRKLVEAYAAEMGDLGAAAPDEYDTSASYSPKDARVLEPMEEDIARVLALTGKMSPEDELNCGACGYYSCREKAVAVIRGMAEPEMCMPYMKSRAETMGNLVVNESPNGIIGINQEMTVMLTNPAMCRITGLSAEKLIGKPLPAAFDREPFMQVFRDRTTFFREAEGNGGAAWAKEAYFHLQAKDMVVLLLSDMSAERRSKESLVKARRETAEKAGRVIDNQVRVAQQVAGLMGEAAAETKVLLTRLIKQLEEDSEK